MIARTIFLSRPVDFIVVTPKSIEPTQVTRHRLDPTALPLVNGEAPIEDRGPGSGQRSLRAVQCEDFIERARTDARQGRLNLPKRRKVVLGFAQAARDYLEKLGERPTYSKEASANPGSSDPLL
jgi:hypothetical protein